MRTLLGAAIGALVAMFFLVPVDYKHDSGEIHHHGTHIRNLIELNSIEGVGPVLVERKINALLLALNVAFSALVGRCVREPVQARRALDWRDGRRSCRCPRLCRLVLLTGEINSDKFGHWNCVILRDSCKLPDLQFTL